MKQLNKITAWIGGWRDDLKGPKGKMTEWEDKTISEGETKRLVMEEKAHGLPEYSDSLPFFVSLKSGLVLTSWYLSLVLLEALCAFYYISNPEDECVYGPGVFMFFFIQAVAVTGAFLISYYPRVEHATKRGMRWFYDYWFSLYAFLCIMSALISLTPLWCHIWRMDLVKEYYHDFTEYPERFYQVNVWMWIVMSIYVCVCLSLLWMLVKSWFLHPHFIEDRLRYMNYLTEVQTNGAKKRAEQIHQIVWKIENKRQEIESLEREIERLKKEGEVEVHDEHDNAKGLSRQERRQSGCLICFLFAMVMLAGSICLVICRWDDITLWWHYYKNDDMRGYEMEMARRNGTFREEDWYTPEELEVLRAMETSNPDDVLPDTFFKEELVPAPAISPSSSSSTVSGSGYSSSSYPYSRIHEHDYDDYDDDDDDDDTWYRGDDDPDEYWEYDYHE